MLSSLKSPLKSLLRLRNLAYFASALAIIAGTTTLTGWAFGIDSLVRLLPGLAPMKPNTALGFMLCGASLLLRLWSPDALSVENQSGKRIFNLRSGAVLLACFAGMIGFVTFLQYLTTWNTGLDTWLFGEALIRDGLPNPGRMTHAAALNFMLLGFALAALDFEPRHGFLPAQHAALLSSLIGLIAMLGYLYGISGLYGFFAYSSMAMHTSFTFTFLGLGVMSARPEKGLMSVVTSPHGGGMMARRLLPAAVLLPALLGWARLKGEIAGYYDMRFGLALFASSNIITFVILIWLSARRLNRLDSKRRQSHDALVTSARDLKQANDRLEAEMSEHRNTEQARKRTEHQLYQSQKMESLGTLAGGIAHDFNNILTAVFLNADRARKNLPAEHTVRKNLDEISQAGTRAADLVRRIMAFGRQEEPHLKTMRLSDAIEESLQLLRLSLPSNVTLQTDLANSLPAVAADSTQIHQILLNLGTNAIHAMAQSGGSLTVKADSVSITGSLASQLGGIREGLYVRLSVSDTGEGMEKKVLDRIFDPFYTTKPPGVGTGLGLSVVHGIMVLHGGCVTAYSELGRGTAFHLYFPAAKTTDAKEPAATMVVPHGNGERILCVDDDGVILTACGEMLEDLGYHVTMFLDPRMAREEFRLRPNSFDLVMTDLSMPGMSGLELIKEIRALKPEVPIILASGYLAPHEAHEAREVGISAFIQKPNVADELGFAIARALGKSDRKDGMAE